MFNYVRPLSDVREIVVADPSDAARALEEWSRLYFHRVASLSRCGVTKHTHDTCADA